MMLLKNRKLHLLLLAFLVIFQSPIYAATKTTYKYYKNARYGFTIKYPSTFKVYQTSANGDGAYIKSSECTITTWGSNNVLEDTPKSALAMYTSGLRYKITYKRIGSNYFIYSYSDGKKIHYSKVIVGKGSMDGFEIVYPSSKSKQYSAIVNEIANTFKAPYVNKSW